MAVGVCTWTLGTRDLQELMQTIAKLGFDAVQYCEDLDAYSPDAVAKAAKDNGLKIMAVDPFNCRPPSDADATLDGVVAFYSRAVDLSAALGPNIPVCLQGMSTWTVTQADDQSQWDMLVSACRTIAEYAAEKSVPLLYELCNRYEVPLMHNSGDYQRLIRALGGANIGVLLDSFHMNIEEEHDPCQVIRRFASKTGIYHISDSNRGGIGTGHIDFVAQFRALYQGGFSGDVAMEVVLPHRGPSGAPRNDAENQQLHGQLRRSLRVWHDLARR
ncbi:sugar phosphate isomerase/epimerase family protein [Gallaecimonas mangrovi]|uniref:sugar phosphate isomerase/epimerase family protein n=1 Tax=Gallaecimonas mangrovi TaxID=2291597 RepID=UPI000E20569F|nr:sugar phosphate isomerase/epimerase family protein [Gallaecimonas mangrovi]